MKHAINYINNEKNSRQLYCFNVNMIFSILIQISEFMLNRWTSGTYLISYSLTVSKDKFDWSTLYLPAHLRCERSSFHLVVTAPRTLI